MLTHVQLDGLTSQVIHLMEFRLVTHRDIPEVTHKTIRNVGAQLRDDIAHHRLNDHLSAPDVILPVPNQAANGPRVSALMRIAFGSGKGKGL